MKPIMQKSKDKVIAIFLSTLLFLATNAYAELRTNMSASVVIGQPDFASSTADQGGSAGANTIDYSKGIYSDGTILIFGDGDNNRVLIYNSVPTTNNASADVVVGQRNFTSTGSDQGGSAGANTIDEAYDVCSDGTRLIVADRSNERVLIYNRIPTSNNASADVVVGQPNFTSTADNQGGSAAANTLLHPYAVSTDGTRLFIADRNNNRVLIYNSIPTSNNASADVVVGQPNFTSVTANQGGIGPNTVNQPYYLFGDGTRLFISDYSNNRVLVYNSIPTSNKASADIVIGQPNFTSNTANQGGGVGANTLSGPTGIFSDGKRLFICDRNNDRLLVWNTIPTSNNASADIVIGQPNFTSSGANQNGSPGANTLNHPYGVHSDGKRLFVGDQTNHRVLIYDIGALPAIKLGPQFEQGKAVLGKVFNDINGNEWQDEGELGIEGIKVASDTGIYAITDEDGKYHFPYIETGQHLLKIDTSTLPEGSVLTTESPRKITVTKGILTKVSFGVKLPLESQPITQSTDEGPLLKVSISQDPILLKPQLQVTAEQIEDNIIFTIDCNYFLFVERGNLVIYTRDYKKIKSIELPTPLPSKYALSIKDISLKQKIFYYQLVVYDRNNSEDRTSIGSFEFE